MKETYIKQIYAGWLGKMIGIRQGALIEGWSSRKIQEVYGEIDGYFTHYNGKLFAADDDSNGPVFFSRALIDKTEGKAMTERDVAEALLNYAPFEHGFFWWGGYGVSTEHTAYLNLQNGIEAPKSGSIEQNGHIVAEQIGGQIFIDCWGLVSPGNPGQAAYLSRKAASVTHDGEGVIGGIFIACCISAAFEKKTIDEVIEIGLEYIPAGSVYAGMVRDIQRYYRENKDNWRLCLKWVQENYGYDKYGGNCHIIPNGAVVVLSLLYGEGDFSRALNICNMCGWDTDCNAGNVGTIMGVFVGVDGIDFSKWAEELQDLLICSGTIGYLNIRAISEYAAELAGCAYRLAGENLPVKWRPVSLNHAENCHFEFPGAVHGFSAYEQGGKERRMIPVKNTSEFACSGERSLRVEWEAPREEKTLQVSRRSYYFPEEFYDSRYNPAFSPKVYPGQTIKGWIRAEQEGYEGVVWARDKRHGRLWESQRMTLQASKWTELSWDIPGGTDALITEYGFGFGRTEAASGKAVFYLDDICSGGELEYTINFSGEQEEIWNPIHREISQFTRMKGLMYIEDGRLNLSCTDLGEAYTGHYYMEDCVLEAEIMPHHGKQHMLMLHVQGARRAYAAGFWEDGEVAILRKEGTFIPLTSKKFSWECGREYRMCFVSEGRKLLFYIDGEKVLEIEDNEGPKYGCAGICVRNGGRSIYRKLKIKGICK